MTVAPRGTGRPPGPLRSVLLASVLAASCGQPLLKLPEGPGAPATDVPDAFNQATAKCRAVSSLTAEVAISGSIGGERVRARLVTGVAAPASARLEAYAFGQPIFVFVATDPDGTLLLTRDQRVLEHERPERILEAVAGVPLDAADLREALLGCAAVTATEGRRVGEDWRTMSGTATDLYLHRETRTGPWRLVAAVHHAPSQTVWRAEYRDFAGDLPREVRFVSRDSSRFDLRLQLSQVELNPGLEREAFQVTVPRGAERITIDDLKRLGPLGAFGQSRNDN
jgi:hypothetical protein